jgi:hypothetical protein
VAAAGTQPPAALPEPGADLLLPWLPEWPGPEAAGYTAPAALAALVARLVDRIERVNQIAAFIPSTRDVSQAASREETDAVVQRTLHYFSQRFGGATSAPAQGAWHSEQAGVVSEGVHLVMSYATEDDLSRHLDDVIEFIRQLKTELRQEAMALEINRKLMLV